MKTGSDSGIHVSAFENK